MRETPKVGFDCLVSVHARTLTIPLPFLVFEYFVSRTNPYSSNPTSTSQDCSGPIQNSNNPALLNVELQYYFSVYSQLPGHDLKTPEGTWRL